MESRLQKLFKNAYSKGDSALPSLMWRAVSARDARNSRIKFWGYLSLGVLSVAGFVGAIRELIIEATQSGFYDYLSLAFSDGGSISNHFQEFTLSLADSLPTTTLILSLSLVFIFFISIRRMARQFRSPLLIS